MTSHYVALDVIALRRTDKALLIKDHEGREPATVWLPLAQITINSERDGIANISVPRWLAQKKGLI